MQVRLGLLDSQHAVHDVIGCHARHQPLQQQPKVDDVRVAGRGLRDAAGPAGVNKQPDRAEQPAGHAGREPERRRARHVRQALR